MKNTSELVEKISKRLTGIREKRLDYLWEDFLGAIEKVVDKLDDEQLQSTETITITYEVRENDENVYRSKSATASSSFNDWSECFEYEENDKCLGAKELLKTSFDDFFRRAYNGTYCVADEFEVDDLFENTGDECVSLAFDISEIDIKLY